MDDGCLIDIGRGRGPPREREDPICLTPDLTPALAPFKRNSWSHNQTRNRTLVIAWVRPKKAQKFRCRLLGHGLPDLGSVTAACGHLKPGLPRTFCISPDVRLPSLPSAPSLPGFIGRHRGSNSHWDPGGRITAVLAADAVSYRPRLLCSRCWQGVEKRNQTHQESQDMSEPTIWTYLRRRSAITHTAPDCASSGEALATACSPTKPCTAEDGTNVTF
jgi:hypothetical protein